LPNTITVIDGHAFENCYKLELTALPSSLETLNSFAFNKCGAGIKINTLPQSLRSIGTYVFNNCPNINIIDFGSDEIDTGL
jgi:hypothetical protein